MDVIAIVNRGFRDTIKIFEDQSVKAYMPELIKKNARQLTPHQANQTVRMTSVRWVVEALNGRLKNK